MERHRSEGVRVRPSPRGAALSRTFLCFVFHLIVGARPRPSLHSLRFASQQERYDVKLAWAVKVGTFGDIKDDAIDRDIDGLVAIVLLTRRLAIVFLKVVQVKVSHRQLLRRCGEKERKKGGAGELHEQQSARAISRKTLPCNGISALLLCLFLCPCVCERQRERVRRGGGERVWKVL